MWDMVEDAITVCIKNGYAPHTVADMECEDFQVAYSSLMRVSAREKIWELNAQSVAANPDKKDSNRKKMIESLSVWLPKAELKQSMGTGDDLQNKLIKKG